jgi:Leucine-rich repeat (LRR) protein
VFPSSQIIGDMPQVRTLSLTANDITEVPVDDWTASLYAASALRELALGENKLTSFRAAFMSLRVLDLHGNRLSTLPTSLTAMPGLSELRLDGNPLDVARLAVQLNESMPLIELKRLNLSACGLLPALPAAFASVFAGLTHLDLKRNGLASIAAGELPDESLEFL